MQDISALNSKLQSISTSLEEVQSKILLQDENVRNFLQIRKRSKDRLLARDAKEDLEKQLAHQREILEQEKVEYQSISQVSCRLEIDRDSADYSLGSIPALIKKTCSDYEKFSTKTGNQIRGKCKILHENNFWLLKQNQANSEREEFHQMLAETLVNRSAFSTSEEERLRTQLEIEETQLAFLQDRISDLESELSRPPAPTAMHSVTPPLSTKPSEASSRPIESPGESRDRAVTSNGATTHSRAFVPPAALALALAPTRTSTNPPAAYTAHTAHTAYTAHTTPPALTTSSPRSSAGMSNPFEDWADRDSCGASASPLQAGTSAAGRRSPAGADSTPPARPPTHQREIEKDHHEQIWAERDARSKKEDRDKRRQVWGSSPYSTALQQRVREQGYDANAGMHADTTLSDADYELDCTAAAKMQQQQPPALPSQLRALSGVLSSAVQHVEVTVSTTTITEFTVQRAPEAYSHHSREDRYQSPSAPPRASFTSRSPHGASYSPHTAHTNANQSSTSSPQQTGRPHDSFQGDFGALGRRDEVPWFREFKRKRTLGPSPQSGQEPGPEHGHAAGAYGGGGYGGGGYGVYGAGDGSAMHGGEPEGQYLPHHHPMPPSSTYPYGLPPAQQYPTPPLWPPTSPHKPQQSSPQQGRGREGGSAGAAGRTAADMRAAGNNLRPVGGSPSLPLPHQGPEVIDLYDTSDDESSDTGPATNPAPTPLPRRHTPQAAQRVTGAQPHSRAGAEVPTVWGSDREPRRVPARSVSHVGAPPHHVSLKDRFRSGLDLLQRPGTHNRSESGSSRSVGDAFGDIDM